MFDWDKVRLFYQVANAGSITIAAQRLNISQPALSRSMLNLESRMKKKLFTRHKRGICLTREGEILYRGAHKMFIESRNIESSLGEGAEVIEGQLTIDTTPAIASSWLMKYLPGFLEKHSKLRLQINGMFSDGNIANSDIMIRPHIPMQPTLVQRHLTSFHMRLYASRSYIEKFGMPKKPQDLDQHRLITFSGELHPLGNPNWILNVGGPSSRYRESFLQINSAHGLLKAAKSGLGIVELGKGFPEVEGVDLVEVLPDEEGPVIDVYYTYPEHKKDIKKITAFYDYFKSLHEGAAGNSSITEVSNKETAILG